MSQRGKGGCLGQAMVDDAVEYSENLAQVVAPRRPHERPEEQEEVGHGGGRDEHLQALRRCGTCWSSRSPPPNGEQSSAEGVDGELTPPAIPGQELDAQPTHHLSL